MKAVSRKARYEKTRTRLTSLRQKSETFPRYVPAVWVNEYNGMLDDLDALGFETRTFRILPRELQPFSSYTAVGGERPATSGYHLSRDLLKERIDSALTHVAGLGLPDKS
jgi:hypothetical protein